MSAYIPVILDDQTCRVGSLPQPLRESFRVSPEDPSPEQCTGCLYDGCTGRPQIVSAAGKNWSMPMHLSVPDSVITGPNVVLSVTTKVFDLPAGPKVNAEWIVPVVLAVSS